jgi:glycosyltransferase involved in cell wall biosynthesis
MKDLRPRVTIGLPTYNGARFLRPAITSILEQDFGDFELLVADNASTDATPAIVSELAAADPRVRHLPSEVNRGAAWNFNRLVDAARGGYFTWMADDDTYEPGFLGACVEVLDGSPDVVLAYTQAVEIDPDGSVIEERGPTNVADLPEVADRFRAVMLDEVYCYAVFGVIRTGVLRSTALIGPYTQSDRVLLAELALHGRFVERPEPYFCHREHPGRSMYKFADDRDRQKWFDTSRDGARTLPRWRIGAEYVQALRRAGRRLPLTDRARCAGHLLPWAVANGSVLSRELARTALSRGRELVDRSGSRPSVPTG